MEEPICHIEISQEEDEIVAKLQSDLGGIREFRSFSFEQTLKMVVNELQEELEFSHQPPME
ncbi:MAG: hypothetical protein U9R75_08695 [Candidatus Thermoplasmatota archaeon]|jgi:hypothetical protein|nr:hypothetical protein [Candidatus Thermoplasmatota archaeon]